MRETRSSGSVEGVISDGHSYSDFRGSEVRENLLTQSFADDLLVAADLLLTHVRAATAMVPTRTTFLVGTSIKASSAETFRSAPSVPI